MNIVYKIFNVLIYHGSDIAVPVPRILSSNRLLDFGTGFYSTSSYEQAKRWSMRVSERKNSKKQIISFYEFDPGSAEKELQFKHFPSPDLEWLNFVTLCRSGKDIDHDYDIVMGPVANDNVYATIQLYETGILSVAETIIRLKVEKTFDQILFHTQEALMYCSYLRYEKSGGPSG